MNGRAALPKLPIVRRSTPDPQVDERPAHQVELTRAGLEALVGKAAVARLLRPPSSSTLTLTLSLTLTLTLTLRLTLTLSLSLSLTLTRLLRLPSSLLGYGEGEAAARLAPSLIFARKYSAASRPWIGFHHDEAECARPRAHAPRLAPPHT